MENSKNGNLWELCGVVDLGVDFLKILIPSRRSTYVHFSRFHPQNIKGLIHTKITVSHAFEFLSFTLHGIKK